jgi:3-oxoacyl-[acyl-carrier-protein] synthase I
MTELSILSAGMVTGVGLNSPATCAAIRCGINNFRETRFMDKGGEWIMGSEVPLERPWRGMEKLARLAASAIRECLDGLQETASRIPLFLCVAEKDRPGKFNGLESELMERVQSELNMRFYEKSAVIPLGKIAGAVALDMTSKLYQQERIKYCLIAGVDTYLTATTLSAFEGQDRLLTSKNSNGFIPGEAGAAVLIGAPNSETGESGVRCLGIGFGHERATIGSEEPLRAEGLVQAIKAALADSSMSMGELDYRITDVNGEQYGFKEASLALTRILRQRKEEFDIWHPADCIGEVGAAIVPVVLSVALVAARKGYSLGGKVLCHFGNDSGERAALILSQSGGGGA